jgi:peptidoglycan/LPS O-acetylase OafA/YrhL
VLGAHEHIPFFYSWSLGIEEKFYLLWPFLIFVVLRANRQLRVPIAAVLASLFAASGQLGSGLGGCLFSYFDILVGCLIALSLNSPSTFMILKRLAAPAAFRILSIAMLAAQFAWAQFAEWPYIYSIDVAHALVSALFFTGLLLGDGRINSFFRIPLLRFLGGISYGIYLVHVPCLNAVEGALHHFTSGNSGLFLELVQLIGTMAVATAVAWCLFRLVERPLISLGRRWSARAIGGEMRH